MSVQTLPVAGPGPAVDKETGVPAPPPSPMIPRSRGEEPAGDWPPDVHLPDEKEDDEC